MIVATLRSDIERFAALSRAAPPERERVAGVLEALLARSASDPEPAQLAYRAFAVRVMAGSAGTSADRSRFEQLLDAIDEFVTDPEQLAPLRSSLQGVMSAFERLIEEPAAG